MNDGGPIKGILAGLEDPTPDAPGILAAIANLPEKALLDEAAMAKALGVSPRTIRRMVSRHELPPPIRLAGRSMWLAGRVLAYLDGRAEKVQKEADRFAWKFCAVALDF